MTLSRDYISSVILCSLKMLKENDRYLLSAQSSERSVCHKIAYYLNLQLMGSGWDVDCEFNRQGEHVPKELMSFERGRKKRVLPDIIVHRRGTTKNLLVIEAKYEGEDQKQDLKKVKAYLRDKKYKYGLLLTLPTSADGEVNTEWWAMARDGAIKKIKAEPSSKQVDEAFRKVKSLVDLLKKLSVSKDATLKRAAVRRISSQK